VEELSKFRKVIEALHAARVRFVIIGGVAMRLQGCSHITDDIDVCYSRDRDNLGSIAGALSPHHIRLRGAPADLPFIFDVRTLQFGQNFTLRTDIGDVDILADAAGVDSFEGLWERSSEMDLYGMRVRVASIDDLLSMKRAANRAKDQNHIMELEALKRLLESGE
jgi:predicted nucleotidyltransferase